MQQRCHHIFDWGWFGRHGAWGSRGASGTVALPSSFRGKQQSLRWDRAVHAFTSGDAFGDIISESNCSVSNLPPLSIQNCSSRGHDNPGWGFCLQIDKVGHSPQLSLGEIGRPKTQGHLTCIVWYSVSNFHWVYIVYSLSISQSLSVLSHDM